MSDAHVPDPWPSGLPVTCVGQWLLASLEGDTERRRRLAVPLNGGKPGFNLDEPAAVSAACELAIGMWFTTAQDRSVLPYWVESMCLFLQPGIEIDPTEAETIVRAALDEAGADVAAIPADRRFLAEGNIISWALVGLGLLRDAHGNSVRTEIVCEAERIAFARGFRPSLATVVE
jgi:hypothetical protein